MIQIPARKFWKSLGISAVAFVLTYLAANLGAFGLDASAGLGALVSSALAVVVSQLLELRDEAAKQSAAKAPPPPPTLYDPEPKEEPRAPIPAEASTDPNWPAA